MRSSSFSCTDAHVFRQRFRGGRQLYRRAVRPAIQRLQRQHGKERRHCRRRLLYGRRHHANQRAVRLVRQTNTD